MTDALTKTRLLIEWSTVLEHVRFIESIMNGVHRGDERQLRFGSKLRGRKLLGHTGHV